MTSELIYGLDLSVKKVRGRDEFDIYKNYINDLPRARILFILHIAFLSYNLELKNDSKAAQIRYRGNEAYKYKNFEESLRLYTESLCHASYNGKEYAVALANRSATYFDMEDYKSCIQDINLCLNSEYPDDWKPKVYIRKAKCYQKLGEGAEMRKLLMDALNFIDDCSSLSETSAEKSRRIIQNLILNKADPKPIEDAHFEVVLPELKMNPTFLNASSSIALKQIKRKGFRVVAKHDIARGDVLFVEKAFAWSPCWPPGTNETPPPICHYCLITITSSVPCKNCVKRLYCNEKCRDDAWNEFHQWECLAIQADFIGAKSAVLLSVLVAIKAVRSGLCKNNKTFEEIAENFGDQDNSYPYLYNQTSDIEKLKKDSLMKYTSIAALWVHYLQLKTNFFAWMKQLPAYANRSEKELMNKVGGLILKHMSQLPSCMSRVMISDVNSDSITIAGAICPSMAMMNHSCLPNTSYYFIGDVIVVKAFQDIKVNEEISYSYAGGSCIALPRELHQAFLKEARLVKCDCKLCVDPKMSTDAINSYLCIKCKGPAQPRDLDHEFSNRQCECLNCHYKFRLPIEVVIREQMARSFMHKFELSGDIKYANMSLKSIKSVFQPHHSMFAELYALIIDYYNSKGNAKCVLETSKLLLENIQRRFGPFSMDEGHACDLISRTSVKILWKTAAEVNLQDFRESLEITTQFTKKAKEIYNLHYPAFIARVEITEKEIFKLRVFHTIRIAKEGRF